MIQKTNKSISSTSFHNQTITATVNELIELFGPPACISTDISDKSQYDWHLEFDTKSNNVFYIFSIYDWKEYRPFSKIELINWHIGSYSLESSILIKEQLENFLYKLRTKKQSVMNTKPNLFQSVKQFINLKGINNTFTTQEYLSAMTGVEQITNYKRFSNNLFYRSHTYKTYLKRLGFISNVKKGLWKVDVLIPDWFDSGYMNIALGFCRNIRPLYKNLTKDQINNKIKQHINFNLELHKYSTNTESLNTEQNTVTETKNNPLQNFQNEIKILASEIIGDGGFPNLWFVTETAVFKSEENGFDEKLPRFENEDSTTYGPFYNYKNACEKYNSINLDAEYGIGTVCLEDREIGIVKEKVLEKIIKVDYVEKEYDDSNLYTK